MKKLFSTYTLIFLFAIEISGQAQVDIPLEVTDGIMTFPMAVGLDLTATNGIDPQLGESDLPPIPPTGIIEIRFDLTPYAGQVLSSYKDYRPPGNPPAFPFSGIIEHTLFWFNGPAGPTLDITYDIPLGVWMTITDPFGGVILNLGPFSGQGVTTIPGTYLINKVLLIMEYSGIVPVELVSFTAEVLQKEKTVQLNWITATETNNSGFEIFRKVQNDNEWNTIGFVPGFGTTTEPKSYSFIDKDITTGIYTYRLKQIDFDGSFEYLNEIEVVVDFTPKEFVLYQNYPNPFNPSTTIKFEIPGQARNDNVPVTLKLYDVLGNEVATLVNEEKQPGVYEVEFDASSIASGKYLYKLQAGSFTETKKMILLR